MDKVIINNQIVLMRKFVKQAKIRAINNYTKEIRLLQNRKGNDDETSKHKRKAERLLSKVVILRKIQPDAVSRKALSKEKNWKDVLKEKNIPLEDQCYAMLANYGPIQSEVEKFHKTHWDLVPKICSLFKSWEEKSKNPMVKQERKKAKELRKSLKAANVKLGKNNSNATPIGPKINDNMVQNIAQTESPLNTPEKDENCNVLNESSDDKNAELNSKPIQNDTTTMTLQNVGTDEETTDDEKVEIKESKNTIRKPPIKRFLKKKLKVDENKTDLNATANKKKLKENLLKPTANSDLEEIDPECESDANSLDIDSEDDDIEDDEDIDKSHESDAGSATKEIPGGAKETVEENKVVMQQKPNLKIPKSVSIQAKLKAMGDVKQKTNTNEKRNFGLKEKNNSVTKQKTSNLKAVTMLNLNELEGLDEIPIEKTDIDTEETGEKKRKRDPFFLGKEGEVVSESEKEDSDSLAQGTDDHDFKRRKLNTFERKSSDGDFFRKRNFPGDAPQNRKPGFRENGLQRNKRNPNFEDKSNSFQNKRKPSFEFHKSEGFKSMPKDMFKNKKEAKSFGDRPFARKQNFHQEPSNKAHFQKNKLSSPLKKSSNDDKPLHPSWEAKKKLKESAKAKFQGKRVVFGD